MMTTGETVPVRLRSFEAGRRSLILLFVQSVVSGGLFAFVHKTSRVDLHVLSLFVITALGIAFAIIVLGLWKRERQREGPVFPWMLLFLVLALAYQTIDGADVYIKEIHDGHVEPATITEGFSFSVQTVTTVGYGNWPFPGMKYDDGRLLKLRQYSIGLMIVGASLFTIVIGMTTTWLLQV
jgi:hypothetical protein